MIVHPSVILHTDLKLYIVYGSAGHVFSPSHNTPFIHTHSHLFMVRVMIKKTQFKPIIRAAEVITAVSQTG